MLEFGGGDFCGSIVVDYYGIVCCPFCLLNLVALVWGEDPIRKLWWRSLHNNGAVVLQVDVCVGGGLSFWEKGAIEIRELSSKIIWGTSGYWFVEDGCLVS